MKILYNEDLEPAFLIPDRWDMTRNYNPDGPSIWHFHADKYEPFPAFVANEEVMMQSSDVSVVAVEVVNIRGHVYGIAKGGLSALVDHPEVASWPRGRKAAAELG